MPVEIDNNNSLDYILNVLKEKACKDPKTVECVKCKDDYNSCNHCQKCHNECVHDAPLESMISNGQIRINEKTKTIITVFLENARVKYDIKVIAKLVLFMSKNHQSAQDILKPSFMMIISNHEHLDKFHAVIYGLSKSERVEKTANCAVSKMNFIDKTFYSDDASNIKYFPPMPKSQYTLAFTEYAADNKTKILTSYVDIPFENLINIINLVPNDKIRDKLLEGKATLEPTHYNINVTEKGDNIIKFKVNYKVVFTSYVDIYQIETDSNEGGKRQQDNDTLKGFLEQHNLLKPKPIRAQG